MADILIIIIVTTTATESTPFKWPRVTKLEKRMGELRASNSNECIALRLDC